MDIEIFKTGKHTDSAGRVREWTEADLAEIETKYNQQKDHEAPLVIGHPAVDAPAYGWVESVQRRGDRLYATLKDIGEEVKQWVDRKFFKKVSIALYPDGLLRHIGLLGAQPPAIKGLAPIRFNEINYKEWTMSDELERIEKLNGTVAQLNEKVTLLTGQLTEFSENNKTLTAENAALKKQVSEVKATADAAAFADFTDKLVQVGKVLPAEVDSLKSEFSELYGIQGGMTFSEGAKNLTERMRDRMAARPVLIEPKKGHFADANQANTTGVDKQYEGLNFSEGSAKLDHAASLYMEKNKVTYEQALNAVLGGANV